MARLKEECGIFGIFENNENNLEKNNLSLMSSKS
tara:strand:+ start:15733 stop:15834 length:102 start_codon:yes stop_codon:yes gene_type:complete